LVVAGAGDKKAGMRVPPVTNCFLARSIRLYYKVP